MPQGLLTFHNVSHGLDDQWDIRNLTWEIGRGDRIKIICDQPEQARVLWKLLELKLKPKDGWIEASSSFSIYSDQLLISRVNFEKNMYQNLESRRFSDQVWVHDRRHHVHGMLEFMEIEIPYRRCPLAEVPEQVLWRFIAVLFIVTSTKILLGQTLVTRTDPLIMTLLEQWSPHFQGSLVFFGNSGTVLPFCKTVLKISASGLPHIESV
ncbi:MAG: hypothetical protein HQM12_01710 [SAR324 cluster bacterium]|nr:hypothetical protein [SAR324 cluster bacterium]MBF0350550.1 hypothetical protein [SAR324 cluster bacterium]